MKKITILSLCLFCNNAVAATGLQFGVGMSATTGLNVSAGFYNKDADSYFLRHFGLRVDLASIDALKSAVDSAIDAIKNADMLIIAGTSLKVYPAASFIDYFSGEHLVIINKEELQVKLNNETDLIICESMGKIFNEIGDKLNII